MLRRTTMMLMAVLMIGMSPDARHDTPNLVKWKVSDGGNGHYYGLVMPDSHEDSYSWADAEAAASSMKFHGKHCYLATITSFDESEFLRSHFSGQLSDDSANAKYAWIGLFSPTPKSGFQSVTGEPVDFIDWAPGEPNYYGTPLWQNVHYWTRDFGNGPTWTWNNEQNFPGRNTYGFFVEFGRPEDE